MDEGLDHLGIFLPLILDVARAFAGQHFSTAQVQEALAARHNVAVPQQTVATLLRRAVAKGHLYRDAGRYHHRRGALPGGAAVGAEKAAIEQAQISLGSALRDHAARRGIHFASTEAALDALVRFLEREQVALLLRTPRPQAELVDDGDRERAVVAEFIRDLVATDPALSSVLRRMLEGLVLYQAAFLPDLGQAARKFRNLRVAFDSTLVRQALGYEGTAMRALLCETVDLLKRSGVQCLVFDKTIHEIQRILAAYEAHLGTAEGRRTLRPSAMSRHFLTEYLSPSDVREMSALLERDVVAAGFQIITAPARVREHTTGEAALAARLADPTTRDEREPRVLHDVDCVAAVVTLRRGHRAAAVEDAQMVFATSSPLLVKNVRLWWVDDEHETGIEPVVDVRGLANLAWLKRPTLCAEFKLRELVALCTAALRPDQATWERFLRHLEGLLASQRITSDEMTAVLVSALSDRLLREAEIAGDDGEDIDAGTLDEVVARVKADYSAEAERRAAQAQREAASTVEDLRLEFAGRYAALESAANTAMEEARLSKARTEERERRFALRIEGKARAWAHRLATGCQWIIALLICLGAVVLLATHPLTWGWPGLLLGLGVVAFVLLELLGILRHVSQWRSAFEDRLTLCFTRWLSPDEGSQG